MPNDLRMDGYTFSQTPAIADGDGDGNPELVIGAWKSTFFFNDCPFSYHINEPCNHWYSYVVSWEFTDGINSDVQPVFSDPDHRVKATTPAVGDVTGDGMDDLVFAGPAYNGRWDYITNGAFWANAIHVYSWDGTNWVLSYGDNEAMSEGGADPSDDSHWFSPEEMMPALGDIDGDEIAEIFSLFPKWGGVGSPRYAKLKVFSCVQNPELIYDLEFTEKYLPCFTGVDYSGFVPAPVLYDRDADGNLEAAFVLKTSLEPTDEIVQLTIVEFDGSEDPPVTTIDLPHVPQHRTSSSSLIAVADKSPDDQGLDTYVTTINVLNSAPEFFWIDPDGFVQDIEGWPKGITEAEDYWGFTPAIVNSFGVDDLEFVTQAADDASSNYIYNFKLSDEYGNDEQWAIEEEVTVNQEFLSSSTITDLDRDGDAELVLFVPAPINEENDFYRAKLLAYDLSHDYIPLHNHWHGYQNSPRHTGLYAQPVSGAVSADVWRERIVVHGTCTIHSGETLTIESGSVIEFRPNATLSVMGTLNVEGAIYDSVYFVPDEADQWTGIIVNGGDVDIDCAVIRGAESGIRVQNFATASINNSTITDCETGVEALNYSCLYLDDTEVSGNSLYGVRGGNGVSVDMTDCIIEYNGDGTYGSAGLSSGGGTAFRLKCCKIQYNSGPGIYNSVGSLTMQDTDEGEIWGGNDISYNSWSEGQVHLEYGWLLMNKGSNKVVAPVFPGNYRLLTFLNNYSDDPAEINGNYWGYTTAGHEDDIFDRLKYESNFEKTGFDYLTSWEFCPNPSSIEDLNVCESYWTQAITHMLNEEYDRAVVDFKHIVENYPDCEFARPAASQILQAEILDGTSYDAIRSYLLGQIEGTTSYDLKYGLKKAAAEAYACGAKYDSARAALDSIRLDASTTYIDSISAQISKLFVDYLEATDDTTDTTGWASDFEALQDSLDAIHELMYGDVVFQPTLEHTPSSPVTRSDDTLSISAKAWAEDDEDMADVVIDYRFWPDGSWVRDTLDESGLSDSTWLIDLALDSLGGGVEYRLLAVDSLGRVEAYPSTGGYPNLNDTLTHFISYEPRVTYLTDTAYIYCPGRLTETIQVRKDGVLYVRPSPLDEEHVLEVDSAKGLWVVPFPFGTGNLGELYIEGTVDDPIVLTRADTTKVWDGLRCNGGYLEMEHVAVDGALYSLYTLSMDAKTPVVRVSNCTFCDGTYTPWINSTTASGADSSVLHNVTFEDMAIDGLLIYEGTLIMDGITIRGSGYEGLSLQDADGLVVTNSTITENASYGVKFTTNSADDDFEVRFVNCEFSLNGGTLPEIWVGDKGCLDLSDGAGNVFKDSAGVLLAADSCSLFDMELGWNSFQLLDTLGGTYVDLSEQDGLSYITGNYFSPESVNDTTFAEDYLDPAGTDRWIYSYLRLENETGPVVEDPNGSVEISVTAYVEDYLGTVAADSIVEVGLKYILHPDSENWTAAYKTEVAADSVYDWSVTVGNYGGLVEYIVWAKDGHGRFVTSPAGADTASPAEGATNFVSYEVEATTIANDSVVIWAPTTLTHSIQVGYNGQLVILPWPGASDHTVTFAKGININPGDINTPYPALYILGTASSPITLEAEADTSEWMGICLGHSTLIAEYTIFRTNTYMLSSISSPVIQLDHCTFETSSSFLFLEGLDKEDSYFRNCVFRDLGEEGGFGSVILGSGDVEISDCWFYDNNGYGIWFYNAYDTEVNNCYFIGNTYAGLYGEGATASMSINCSEFSYNGGDTTAEVAVYASTLDFTDEAGCIFADKAGVLLEGAAMVSFEIDSGGNGFYLFDSTGTYIFTEDETDTMLITGNYWYPFASDTSIFWDFFDPDASQYWTDAEDAEEVASCEGSSSSMAPGGDIVSLRRSQEAHAMDAGPSGSRRMRGPVAVQRKQTIHQAATQAYSEARRCQQSREYGYAAQKYKEFIERYPDHPKTAPALSRYAVSMKKSGRAEHLSDFFQRQEQRLTSPYARKIAHWLYLENLAAEGRFDQALAGYEEIIAKPVCQADSVHAVIGAMKVHLDHHSQQTMDSGRKTAGKTARKLWTLPTAYPENIVTTLPEFYRRAVRLTASVKRGRGAEDDAPAQALIPERFKLHQNYPNPFNPTTEIRFDLPDALQVELKVFNILGQEVATLIDEMRPAGFHRIQWNSQTTAGASVASGVYIYQIKAGQFIDAKKMVLIR